MTDALGRQSYMAYRRSPLLQPMFLVEFSASSSARAELHRFGEMTAAVPLLSVPFDVRKSTIALFMAELLYRLVREQEPAPALFEFVWEAVVKLDNLSSERPSGKAREDFASERTDACVSEQNRSSNEASGPLSRQIANFHLWFLVGLSRHLGFAPAGEWTAGGWFDYREGVFTPVRPTHGLHFSAENSELLWRLMHDDPGAIALNRGRRSDFLTAMLDFLGYHLDAVRNIKSIEILREVF